MSINLKEKTLGILSSWTENCGNASYTRQLIEELSKHFKKAQCIPLNQQMIQSGMSVEKEVIAQVKQYDFINIQYEAALYGKNSKKSFDLLRKIIKNHDSITITIHSLIQHPEIEDVNCFSKIKFNFNKLLRNLGLKKQINSASFSTDSYAHVEFLFFLNKMIRLGKKINLIVHRKEILNYVKKFNIPAQDHPIVSATNRDIIELNCLETRKKFIDQFNLDESKIYLGVFGFLGKYKGFDIALNALALLPDNYNLIMCCQRHPNSNAPISKAWKKRGLFGKKVKVAGQGFNADEQTKILNSIILEKNLTHKIRYINHLIDEEDFKLAIAGVDIPLFPYYEVGQGGSGPISYALHLNYGGKIIASRTKAFEDYYNDYYPKCFTLFDQGNHVELADKVMHVSSLRDNIIKSQKKYGVDSNIKTYLEATIANS